MLGLVTFIESNIWFGEYLFDHGDEHIRSLYIELFFSALMKLWGMKRK